MNIREHAIFNAMFTLIFFSLCHNTMSKNIALSTNKNWQLVLGDMTKEIALKYFSNLRCILIVVEENGQIENLESFIPSSIQRFNVRIKQPLKRNMEFLQKTILDALNEKCLGYIFMVSDPVVTIILMEKSFRLSQQRARRRILFLPVSKTDNGTATELDDMFNMREIDFFPDILVARFSATENLNAYPEIELVTNKFSGKSTSNELVVLDIWMQRRGFLLSADLYPDKISNLMGKTMILATFDYKPYDVVDMEAEPPLFDGTESHIIKEFCKIVNASCELIVDAVNQWGEIYENASGNGVLGLVSEDRADIGIASLYLWTDEYSYVDYSATYIRTGVTCLAPKPQPLPGWLTAILPFTITSWSAVGASVLASALSLFFITKASNSLLGKGQDGEIVTSRYFSLWRCTFDALGLLLQQTPADEDTDSRITGPARHVLVWLTIMFLLIATSYSSGLASILTVPRFGPPIETADDLTDSNIPWAATHPAWLFSLRDAQDPRTLLLISHFRVMSEKLLRKHSAKGDIAFPLERLPGGHYALGEYIREEDISKRLRLMKQDIYYAHVMMITRKGSPYMAKLNKLLLRLVDSGLILKWEEQVVSKFLPRRVQLAVSHSRASDGNGPTVLQLRHIQGGLYLLALGLSISSLACMYEVIYYNHVEHRRKY